MPLPAATLLAQPHGFSGARVGTARAVPSTVAQPCACKRLCAVTGGIFPEKGVVQGRRAPGGRGISSLGCLQPRRIRLSHRFGACLGAARLPTAPCGGAPRLAGPQQQHK